MYERFTERARKVMQLANQEAQRRDHQCIGTKHLLLGLIKEGSGVGAHALCNLGVPSGEIRLELEKHIQDGSHEVEGKLPHTPRAKKVIEFSMEESRHLSHTYVGTEHMLLGLLRVQGGLGRQVLESLGLELKQVRQEVLNLLGEKYQSRLTRPHSARPRRLEEAKPINTGLQEKTESVAYVDEDIVDSRKAMLTSTMRILDATFNRAVEGLRVTEDYVRFVLDDHHLTAALKALRHDVLAATKILASQQRLTSRDASRDIGTKITTIGETNRQDLADVFFANMQRARQSLRSLEEFGKIIEPRFAEQIEALRYRLYTLEKAVAVSQESQHRLHNVLLCVLVDGQGSTTALADFVDQLRNSGVDMFQLRDKHLSDRELLQRARVLTSFCKEGRSSPPPLVIINDRADIAAAADADGVHLGEDDLGVKDARAILGPDKLVGVSTHSVEQARIAVLDGANYLGAGPTFPSSTKSFDQFPGLDYLRQIAAETTLPTFAIGGIQAENLPQVLATGITRIAVSGCVAAAADPGQTASQLLKVLSDAPGGGTAAP